jgi:hypothetical protein
MKKSMSELVAGVKVNKSSKSRDIARASEWPNCCHTGCPLPTTIKADRPTCTYHFKENGYSAECITEAVKEHHGYIKKLHQMIYWDTRQWRDKKPQLQGWAVLPATEQEMELPTLYIKRFQKWIDKSIKTRAEEIYQGH